MTHSFFVSNVSMGTVLFDTQAGNVSKRTVPDDTNYVTLCIGGICFFTIYNSAAKYSMLIQEKIK